MTDFRYFRISPLVLERVLGYDSAFTQLNVVELPRFTVSPPSKLEVEKKQNITVRCQATGDPKPTITWVRKNDELPVGRSRVDVDGTLQIWNPKEEDSGIYTCTAASAEVLKAFSAAMKLTVTKGEIFPTSHDLFHSQCTNIILHIRL